MSKILSDIATGNDDTQVNDENSSEGNFNISDACDNIILGNASEELLLLVFFNSKSPNLSCTCSSLDIKPKCKEFFNHMV